MGRRQARVIDRGRSAMITMNGGAGSKGRMHLSVLTSMGIS